MIERVVGRIGNLSETGMLLMANTAAARKTRCTSSASPLRDGGGHEVQCEFGAHQLWQEEAGTPGPVLDRLALHRRSGGPGTNAARVDRCARRRSSSNGARAPILRQNVVPHAREPPAISDPIPRRSYADHLDDPEATRRRRAANAAVSTSSSCPAARLHYQFFDDRDYPYAVNPQFKAWLPLTECPGSWLVYHAGQASRS